MTITQPEAVVGGVIEASEDLKGRLTESFVAAGGLAQMTEREKRRFAGECNALLTKLENMETPIPMTVKEKRKQLIVSLTAALDELQPEPTGFGYASITSPALSPGGGVQAMVGGITNPVRPSSFLEQLRSIDNHFISAIQQKVVLKGGVDRLSQSERKYFLECCSTLVRQLDTLEYANQAEREQRRDLIRKIQGFLPEEEDAQQQPDRSPLPSTSAAGLPTHNAPTESIDERANSTAKPNESDFSGTRQQREEALLFQELEERYLDLQQESILKGGASKMTKKERDSFDGRCSNLILRVDAIEVPQGSLERERKKQLIRRIQTLDPED